MVAWLLVALAAVGGAAASLYLRWRLQRAENQVELWQTQAKRTAGELADLVKLGREERTRQDGVIRDLRSQIETARNGCADLALRHPELAADYVREQLRSLAAPAPGDRAHPVVPARPAPGGPGGTGGSGGSG